MRYIPGYIMRVGQNVSTKSISLLDKRRITQTRDMDFQSGKNYVIYNIKPSDNKFIYTFKTSEGSLFQIEFNSIEDAEQRIAKLVGDVIEKPKENNDV